MPTVDLHFRANQAHLDHLKNMNERTRATQSAKKMLNHSHPAQVEWNITHLTQETPGEQGYLTDKKELAQNQRQALKLKFDYYHKHQQFSCGVGEDWQRHLHQFSALANEYESPLETRISHFQHSLKPRSTAFQYFLKLREHPIMS